MKNIVVMTELTKAQENVCQYGLKLAQQLKSNLILLHANGEVNAEALQSLLEIRENIWKNEEKQLDDKTAITCLIEKGTFSSAVERLSNKINVDLIVMGVNSGNTNRSLLFENKIKEVVDRTNCPILLIPEDICFRELRCIYYITDISYNDFPVVTKLTDIAKPLNVQVSLVHMCTDDLLNQDEGVTKTLFVDSFSKNIKHSLRIYKNNGDKNVEHTISQIVSNKQVIIAMAHCRHDASPFIESCSKSGNAYRSIPLLLMPAQ